MCGAQQSTDNCAVVTNCCGAKTVKIDLNSVVGNFTMNETSQCPTVDYNAVVLDLQLTKMMQCPRPH
jgi:hypothetical protein